MSERMIQLQRERLLAAGKGSRASAKGGAKGSKDGSQQQAKQTPQQRAAAAVRTEDEQLGNFIQRLSHRDDSREGSLRVPTVPTALTRRILNKQGAGFLDPTIAAAVSAAGDRFLATVLHQAVACRDQRLKGAEVQREASQTRKRHLDQVEADKDDRERRREEKAKKREQVNMETIMTAEAVTKKKGGDKDTKPSPKSKKKKKSDDGSTTGPGLNGAKLKKIDRSVLNDNDDEQSFDSMDEEEEYYKRYYGDDETGVRDDDEEDDEALLLRDLVHPLEAWQFTLSGKKGLLPNADKERGDGRTNVDAEAEDGEKITADGEDGDEEPESDDDGEGDGIDSSALAAGGGTSSTTNRKGAASPLPADKNEKIKKSPATVPAGGQSAAQPPRSSSSPVPS